MTHWMCSKCGYYVKSDAPPTHCPACDQVCAFQDVTCYRPDYGGQANLDPVLVAAIMSRVSAYSLG